MAKSVEIVTVNKIIPIYKEGQEANSINVINFLFKDGSECGYNVVSQKGLYEIGSQAVYLQPDYCLSDISLFDSFIRPGGEINKSRLGKNNRIRAIKFNFQFENSVDPIYSCGILLPKSTIDSYIKRDCDVDDIDEILGITKYEEPEKSGSGLTLGTFPGFLYKTDEENINNIKSHVKRIIAEEQEFGLTIKTDGSSFTQYFRKNEDGFYTGICSRLLEKKLEQSYVSEYINGDKKYHKYIHPETKVKGWFCDELNDFKLEEEIKDFDTITIEVKDSWIELSKSTGLFEKGMKYCLDNNVQLAFRGEIFGQGLKGSGNKLNPDAQSKQGLKLFGIDSLDKGFGVRQHYGNEHSLSKVCDEIGLDYNVPLIIKPSSYEELVEICENIFKEQKANGKVIEGLVIRTMYSNDLSCKFMNQEYDSRK